ncbi:hypothetical protein [Streptomyces sp. NPDC001743]|uniref:hypothetical protein n=1 Tax=Streptomyces sp. NPDC001743 TaxID=3154397 RepID=UPI00332BD1CC
MSGAPEDGGMGILAVAAGPSCLHIEPGWGLMGFLRVLLPPSLHGAEGSLRGVPGLRLVAHTPEVTELRGWGGHGRLVLHTGDDEGREWAAEEERMRSDPEARECYRRCAPAACTTRQSADETIIHPLHTEKTLHLAEHVALLTPAGGGGSDTLRAKLSHLPPLCTVHDLPPLSGRVLLARPARVVTPDLLAFAGEGLRAGELADAFASQLVRLLRAGHVRAGDLITDHGKVVAAVGGRAAAARWAQLVLKEVSQRYNLLRYRAPLSGDPARPVRAGAGVWVVSEAAPVVLPKLGLPSGGVASSRPCG